MWVIFLAGFPDILGPASFRTCLISPILAKRKGAMEGRKSPLLEHVRAELRTRHYSHRTERAYVGWIRRFVLFHGKRHPQLLGLVEVQAFLTHLATARNVAAPTQNQALNALL